MCKGQITYGEALTMTSTLLDIPIALKQALVKERLTSEPIATLAPDFYKVVKQHMSTLDDKARQEMQSALNSLILMRQPRLLRLADANALTDELLSKMTTEERLYCNIVSDASKKFREEVS